MTHIDLLRSIPDDVFRNIYLKATKSAPKVNGRLYGRHADLAAEPVFSELFGEEIKHHTITDRRHELGMVAWARLPKMAPALGDVFASPDTPAERAVDSSLNDIMRGIALAILAAYPEGGR
jgi:hypothetical protein